MKINKSGYGTKSDFYRKILHGNYNENRKKQIAPVIKRQLDPLLKLGAVEKTEISKAECLKLQVPPSKRKDSLTYEWKLSVKGIKAWDFYENYLITEKLLASYFRKIRAAK